MQQPVNGAQQPSPTIQDVIRDATATTNEMLNAFVNTARLINFPGNLIGPAGLQIVLQTVMLNNQSGFYNAVTQILLEVLRRTEGTEGGLDPKAIQREMARRNVAVAMGPDPDVLQQLVQGSNHASAVQERELAELREQLETFRDLVQALLENGEYSEDLKRRANALLLITGNLGQDPGSIPDSVPMDGTLPKAEQPQP